MPAQDEFVARLNIDHFRKKLATETDEAKRKTLLSLLAEEEAKLAAILRQTSRASAIPANASGDSQSGGRFRR